MCSVKTTHSGERECISAMPTCVQMNATGAEYSQKSINIPLAPMTGIVLIYECYPAECAEC